MTERAKLRCMMAAAIAAGRLARGLHPDEVATEALLIADTILDGKPVPLLAGRRPNRG